MKRKLLRIVATLTSVLVLSLAVVTPAFAVEEVTVTATPAFLAISNAPGTWAPNDIVGDGVSPKGFTAPDTVYYSNPLGDELVPSDPVVDGECRFTITNTSTIPIDLTVDFPDFTGGDASTNTDDVGANGVGAFGAFSYCTGMTYSTGKVVAKTTGSAAMKSALAATTDIKWGLTYETQSDDWTSGTAMESTVVITATASN